MAAYAALVSLMHIIDDIQRHHSPPISLDQQQLQSLTQVVTSLQEFLEAYNSPFADGDGADPLEIRIADAAYAAEDVIQSHIVDEIHPQNQQTTSLADSDEPDLLEIRLQNRQTSSLASKISSFFNYFRAPKKPENVDDEQNKSMSFRAPTKPENVEDEQINGISFRAPKKPENVDAEEIKSINFFEDLQQVIDEMELINKEAMKIDTEKAGVIHNHGVSASAAPLRSFSSSSAMVCPKAVLHGIMEKLTGDGLDRQVISIEGMGGIGKTILARNIYAHPHIKQYFDVCAWVTISQQYNTKEILCEVLSQATNKENEQLSERSEYELGLELYKYLSRRRFLIVLDDMWSIDAWENVQEFFHSNQQGSRILVTTRLSQLSSQLNTSYTHQMEFLDEFSSWVLFSKTVFGEGSCPLELMNIGMKIVDNCRGLPLSIVVVGGILKKMEHTLGCWESIRNNLTSVVNLENDKHCLRLLKLSYNHLPVYLKPCFLYMGVFGEDDEIKVSTLIEMWVSEGFLKPMNDSSSEMIAMGFLNDLVDRNLIMIAEWGSTGNKKSCKIHDLLRDLCLNEVQKVGFFHVIGRSRGTNRQCRRVVIPRNTSKEKVREGMQSMPRARARARARARSRSVICEKWEVPPGRNFGLLSTFQVSKFRTFEDQSYMNSLAFQYVNLRHLDVEVRSMSSFFSSITLFWNLHTLIVTCPYHYEHESTAPSEIWKMRQLRHIEFPEQRVRLPDPPSDMDEDIMENLRMLKGVNNLKCCEEVVKRIPNIKKLKLKYVDQLKDTMSDDYYCVSNIKYLSKLESLYVNCGYESRGASYPHKLSFPQSLKKLTLSMKTEFEWEEMLEKIGSLPCLEKLKLWMGCFGTGQWEIVEGPEEKFRKLKYLGLFYCKGLKQWTVEDSSLLPRLEHLHLYALKELEEIPREIVEISTLQKIRLLDCSESSVRSMKLLEEEQLEFHGEQLPFDIHVSLANGRTQLFDEYIRFLSEEEIKSDTSKTSPNFSYTWDCFIAKLKFFSNFYSRAR